MALGSAQKFVVPAKAGTQSAQDFGNTMDWITGPAQPLWLFAGMTNF
jgi:hypothetical protein